MPLLSVIVPLYNEASTAEEVLAALVAKRVAGLDIEIVLIESNSTDGTGRSFVRMTQIHNPILEQNLCHLCS